MGTGSRRRASLRLRQIARRQAPGVAGRIEASRQRGELPDQPPRWVPAGLVVWIISAAAGYWVHIGIPAVNSILLAFLLYAAAGTLGLTRGCSRTAGGP